MKLTVLLGFISFTGVAQIQTLDLNTNTSNVRYNDPTITTEDKGKMNYSDVHGRYLWDENWKPAKIKLKTGHLYFVKQAKLNLYVNGLHYINTKGEELVAGLELLKSIKFLSSKDTSQIEGSFESFLMNRDKMFEILCSGKIQFLKKVTVTLKKENYDVLVGKHEYRFISNIKYFLKIENKVIQLNSLNKDSLAGSVEFSSPVNSWLTQNKNKLKKEEDFIEFLKFYNSLN